MKIFLLILFLYSCGQIGKFKDNIKNPKNKNPRKYNTTNPIFEPYIAKFELYYGKSITDIPINFSKLENRIAGICYNWNFGYREIEIDKDQWEDELTEDRKLALIFHELGHCELGLDHNDSLRKDKCPHSLMHSVLVRENCLKKYKEEYLEEIF